MKVGIVAPGFTPGATGGVETYLRNLLAGLQDVDRANEYVVFAMGEADELELSAANFTGVELRERGLRAPHRRIPLLRRRWSVARRIAAHRCDVLHFPYQDVWPSGLPGGKVLSFQDLQHEHFPEFFSDADLAWRRRAYPASCDEADHIACISDFTRRDVIARYGVNPDKISTVHLAFGRRLASAEAGATGPVGGSYLLYPAAGWPHKNHLRLIEAFARLAPGRPGLRLVLTGLRSGMAPGIDEAIRTHRLEDRIVDLGYVPYDELPALFGRATALVYPSLFEGFGIPLAEAMAAGCPIVSSNATALPEVGGDAAIYFDPLDVGAIEDAIRRVVDSEPLRADLIARGRARADAFTDTLMAQRTLAIYELAMRCASERTTAPTRPPAGAGGA